METTKQTKFVSTLFLYSVISLGLDKNFIWKMDLN